MVTDGTRGARSARSRTVTRGRQIGAADVLKARMQSTSINVGAVIAVALVARWARTALSSSGSSGRRLGQIGAADILKAWERSASIKVYE